MLLQVKGLRVNYDGAEAVRGVSFNIEEGSLVSIIGANGAGKSTILRTISGLVRPSEGEIWFCDARIDRRLPHDIVQLGITQAPEGRRLFPQMSVLENLLAGGYLVSNRKELNSLLESVYHHFPVLKERQGQQAGSLSGGQQQMLAIGRAMMSKPKLLMMDEPSLGLSPIMVDEVGRIMGTMKKAGNTILLVEQNSHLALALADTTYVLELGRILLQGKSEDLMNNELVKSAYLGT